ncbi:MAG TPA: hypothetical protein VE753_04520 [Gaiellaceae bacterium]|nr:hypothetical protein [Gaiellaceae bacterium]
MSERAQRPTLPKTWMRPPGATAVGRTYRRAWTAAAPRVAAGDSALAAPACRFFAMTEIDAVPLMPPAPAVIVPVPTVPALKVVGLPGFGENVPSAGDTV